MTSTSPLDPTTARTLPDFIRSLGQAYGDKPAVLRGEEILTFRELEARSAQMAAALLLRGVGKGTKVGIIYSNSPRWLVLWAAVTRIGAIAVPLSTFLKPPELARIIRHADLHAVVSQPSFLAQDFVHNLEEAFPDLPRVGAGAAIDRRPLLKMDTCRHRQSAGLGPHQRLARDIR